MFKKELEISADIYHSNKANIYLYLNKDVEYVQDGTRFSESERNLLDSSHRNVLIDHNIDIIELKGDWNQRFNIAVEQINKLILSIELK
jgi:HTH-type transcriptional repressor of NAD biosynthesis genes